MSWRLSAASNVGRPLTLTVRGLPNGLSFNPATGVVSGAVRVRAGHRSTTHYTVTFTATDSAGVSTRQLRVVNVRQHTIVAKTSLRITGIAKPGGTLRFSPNPFRWYADKGKCKSNLTGLSHTTRAWYVGSRTVSTGASLKIKAAWKHKTIKLVLGASKTYCNDAQVTKTVKVAQ